MPFVLIAIRTMAAPRSWLSISHCRYRFQIRSLRRVAIGINCCLLDYPILVAVDLLVRTLTSPFVHAALYWYFWNSSSCSEETTHTKECVSEVL